MARPKGSGRLWNPDVLETLGEIFPNKTREDLDEALHYYPGDRLEGLIEILSNSRIFCGICMEDSFEVGEVVYCSKEAHSFCVDCAKRALEHQIGEGAEIYFCFTPECGSTFKVQELEIILEPKVYTNYIKNICSREVKKVLPDLETCPHCGFGLIIEDPDVKDFVCLDPSCRKSTCRDCERPSHQGLCHVLAGLNDNERHRAEDVITRAVVRQCRKCDVPFQKYSGCNRMTCKCGFSMCYICGIEAPNYDHFYSDPSGPIPDKCPIQADPNVLHETERLSAEARVTKNMPRRPTEVARTA